MNQQKKNIIKFGTDGWRAIIAEDFTFDNVRLCTQGFAEYLKNHHLTYTGILVTYDTRFASENFAMAVAEVLSANGIKVYISPVPTPTPMSSFGIKIKGTAGGVIITASHNPSTWNGYKIKSPDGASAADETIGEVEYLINKLSETTGKIYRTDFTSAISAGLIQYYDPAPDYIKHIQTLLDINNLKEKKLKVVVDAMYGAGIGYLKLILGNGNVSLTEINSERNPSFPGINPEPIAVNLIKLSQLVIEQKADIGIATDGDADRIGIIDENGNFLTQLQVFSLLALYFLDIRGERGPIVKTVTSSTMLNKLGQIFNVPVFETAVGFKYVAPLMMKYNALIGGEESGGYGFRGHVPERDGILSALYFLDFMAKTGKKPSELLAYLYEKVGQYHYKRIDIRFKAEKRDEILRGLEHRKWETICGIPVINIDTVDGYRYILKDGSWLLIRFSGTEPVMRIYAESDSMARVEMLLEEGKRASAV